MDKADAGRWGRASHGAVLLSAVFATGCGDAPPPSPTAVVRATPKSVCHADSFETRLRLDASESTEGLSLVPPPPAEQAPQLEFRWALSGAAHQIEGTDPSGIEMWVRTAGDRPLHVELTVTNVAGGEATTLHSVPITFLDLGSCETDACSAGERCTEHHGRDVCVPDVSCAVPADCPVCLRCDDSLGSCVPTEAVP